MTKVLYVATGNAGKLRDFQLAAEGPAGAAAGFGIAAEGLARADAEGLTLLPLPGLPSIAAPPEDAESFVGNAQAKATYYSRFAPGEVVIADDSGLEVDALDGAPGVYSARYAERAGTARDAAGGRLDDANNAHLLAELARVLTPAGLVDSLAHRSGRFRCALAAARDGACLCTAEGDVGGLILPTQRGEGGFGYDSLFYLPKLQKTMAELDRAMRLGLSHRGAALRALLPKLSALLKG